MKAVVGILAVLVFSALGGACMATSRTVRESPGADVRTIGVDAGPKDASAGGDVATVKATVGPVATSMPVAGDADTAVVMAKLEIQKLSDRLTLLNKDIQKSVNGELKATRDAVQNSTQTTGMEGLVVLGVVFVLRFGDVAEAWVAGRYRAAEAVRMRLVEGVR